MAINRARFTFWLLFTCVYLLLTGVLIAHAVSCEGKFCGFALGLLGLPWTFLLVKVIPIDALSPAGWGVLFVACVLLNISILYVTLGVGRRGGGPEVS